ncbi:hypothetical protein GE09DRAFT_1223401 [Coniochaeta sp. 2T2.1]|nr:hypothetical protein GE09DRAFT_1223401 [Coniochaeta sp. 2T2.1]
MSPPTSHPADIPMEGYAGAAGSTIPGLPPYRRPFYEPVSSVSPCVRPMEAQPRQGLPSSPYPNLDNDEVRQQTPMSDEDDFSDGLTSGHFVTADPDECISPSAKDEEKDLGRASSVPASPNTNKPVETPYAQLIYQALMSTSRHAMKLQEIYQWFIQNTDKGKPGQGTGWQNSVRHNLSMNGAFERRPIKDAASDGDYSSPSGTSKPATEWVLVDEYVDGVLSTTRYRNASRRSQNKKLRSNRSRAPMSSHRSSRRRVSDRPAIPHFSLPPPVSRYDLQLGDYRSYGYYASAYDTPADQLQRLSLSGRPIEHQRRALCYTGGNDYEQAEYHPASHLGGQLEANMHGSRYALAPLNYSSELFMPSVPGAPTVASEDDVNEVITPEASYSVLEPTVLLPGDSSNSSSAHLGPTSDPYNNGSGGGSAYFGSQHGANPADAQSLVPRYTLGDVAGVCDENMLRSCGWNDNQPSHQ